MYDIIDIEKHWYILALLAWSVASTRYLSLSSSIFAIDFLCFSILVSSIFIWFLNPAEVSTADVISLVCFVIVDCTRLRLYSKEVTSWALASKFFLSTNCWCLYSLKRWIFVEYTTWIEPEIHLYLGYIVIMLTNLSQYPICRLSSEASALCIPLSSCNSSFSLSTTTIFFFASSSSLPVRPTSSFVLATSSSWMKQYHIKKWMN